MTKIQSAALAASALLGLVVLRSSSSPPGPMPPTTPPPPPPGGGGNAGRRAAAVAVGLAEFARVNAPGAPPANPADYWAVAADQKLTAAEVQKLDWCGGFYLWALKMGGVAPASVFWKFDGTGIGSARLKPTSSPAPADLAYFLKNQHHALIESVDGDTIHLINGNGGGKGITRSSVSRGEVAAFYSVDPLLRNPGLTS
jgi:hypothetical protein